MSITWKTKSERADPNSNKENAKTWGETVFERSRNFWCCNHTLVDDFATYVVMQREKAKTTKTSTKNTWKDFWLYEAATWMITDFNAFSLEKIVVRKRTLVSKAAEKASEISRTCFVRLIWKDDVEIGTSLRKVYWIKCECLITL